MGPPLTIHEQYFLVNINRGFLKCFRTDFVYLSKSGRYFSSNRCLFFICKHRRQFFAHDLSLTQHFQVGISQFPVFLSSNIFVLQSRRMIFKSLLQSWFSIGRLRSLGKLGLNASVNHPVRILQTFMVLGVRVFFSLVLYKYYYGAFGLSRFRIVVKHGLANPAKSLNDLSQFR